MATPPQKLGFFSRPCPLLRDQLWVTAPFMVTRSIRGCHECPERPTNRWKLRLDAI